MSTPDSKDGRYDATLAALRAAIDEGDTSGIAKGKVFARVRKELNYRSEHVDQMICEGLDDIDRGDTIDGEEAFRQLRVLSAARRREKT